MDNTAQEYISKMREAGKSNSEIKQELLKVGWNEKDIPIQSQQQPTLPDKPTVPFKGLVIGVSLLILGILFSGLIQNPEDLGELIFIVPGYIFILIGTYIIIGASNKTLISFFVYSVIGIFSLLILPSLNDDVVNWILLAFWLAYIITSIRILYRSGFYKKVLSKIKNIKNTSQ